jgi:hypothetical protein
MDERPLRYRAYEVYSKLVRDGRSISPAEFSRLSKHFLGEEIPLDTVRYWIKIDGWTRRIISDEFGDTEELSRTLEFMESSLSVVNSADSSTAEVASAASEYRKMVALLPNAFLPLLEEEIIALRERLFSLYKIRKGKASHTTLSRLSSIWADLGKFVIPEITTSEEATVSADELILRQRHQSPGS